MVKSYYFIDKKFHKKLVDYKLVENEPTFLKTILWTWVSFDMAFLRVILDRLLFHLLINVGLSIMSQAVYGFTLPQERFSLSAFIDFYRKTGMLNRFPNFSPPKLTLVKRAMALLKSPNFVGVGSLC